MKALVSVDLEGMPHVVIPGHLNLKGTLYNEARKITTKVTVAVVEELKINGFDEIIIADSHGPMVNVLVDDLPEYVEVLRGYPRPVSMVSEIERCDAALFLGYHAKFGTAKSTFDHTYSGRSISKVEVNGVEASEFLLNAYAAGDVNVSVILVAGEDRLLEDDVKKHTPWAETVRLKRSLSRFSAKSFSMIRVEKELKNAVKKAVANFKQAKVKPLVAKKPVEIAITFSASHFADAAELLPTVTRTNGLKVKYTATNVTEAYKIFELLVLAAGGASALLANMK
jgi:D-amino peptidase